MLDENDLMHIVASPIAINRWKWGGSSKQLGCQSTVVVIIVEAKRLPNHSNYWPYEEDLCLVPLFGWQASFMDSPHFCLLLFLRLSFWRATNFLSTSTQTAIVPAHCSGGVWTRCHLKWRNLAFLEHFWIIFGALFLGKLSQIHSRSMVDHVTSCRSFRVGAPQDLFEGSIVPRLIFKSTSGAFSGRVWPWLSKSFTILQCQRASMYGLYGIPFSVVQEDDLIGLTGLWVNRF